MTRVAGTLTMYFDDSNAIERNLLAIQDSEIVFSSTEIEVANPDGLDWKYSRAEMSEWRVSGKVNLDMDDGNPEPSQMEIEALAFAKVVFAVTLIAPNGAQYAGDAFVTNYTINTSDQTASMMSIELRGVGELITTNPAT